jgi:hypothetical protein
MHRLLGDSRRGYGLRLITKSSTSVTASIVNSEIATHAVISTGEMVTTTGKADRLPITRVIQEDPVPVPVPAIKSVAAEPSPVAPLRFVSRHWHDPLDSNAKADQQLTKLGSDKRPRFNLPVMVPWPGRCARRSPPYSENGRFCPPAEQVALPAWTPLRDKSRTAKI